MALFVEHISTLSADISPILKSKVTEWIVSQTTFIQALFGNIAGKVELINFCAIFKLAFIALY